MKIPAAFLFLMFLAATAVACKVPVFRYALERWPADSFRLLVAKHGPFAPELQADLTTLQESLSKTTLPVNLTLEAIDLSQLTEIQQISLPGIEHLGNGPSMVLLPPESWRSDSPVWTGAATPANLATLLDSPARQRCAEHLLAGETAVWIMIPSGDPAQDHAARTLLADSLERASSTLKIPEGVIRREDLNQDLRNIDLDDILRSDLPLRISFVTETIQRDDPAEAAFLTLLLGPARAPATGPLLIPVFGRGRTPGPLPATRFTEEDILAACEYLCGSCSCQAKVGNPGYDLLFHTNWDNLLDASVITADSPIIQNALDVVTYGDAPPDHQAHSSTERPSLLPMMLSTIGAIGLFFGLLLWALVWQRRKRA